MADASPAAPALPPRDPELERARAEAHQEALAAKAKVNAQEELVQQLAGETRDAVLAGDEKKEAGLRRVLADAKDTLATLISLQKDAVAEHARVQGLALGGASGTRLACISRQHD